MLPLRGKVELVNLSIRAGLHKPLSKWLTRTKIDKHRSVMLIEHDVGRIEIVVYQPKRVKMLDRGFYVSKRRVFVEVARSAIPSLF